MMSVPLWVRVLQRTDRLAWYAYHGYEVLRDELLIAWLDPAQRESVIERAYREQRVYLPGGTTFERGLFQWERTLLERPEVPRAGRVLLAAAGGGRELKALAQRGYDVTAFEPNPVLREGAQQVAAQCGGLVLDGAYADLSLALHGRGPLRVLRARAPYDLVVLGWGSITHVLEEDDRLALLESVRALAPSAPVITSFFLRPESGHGGRTERLRRALRATFTKLGAPNGAAPEGLAYEAGGGFVYAFTESEVQALAHRAGYAVAVLESSPFPHALLIPHEVMARPVE
jgi:SAM-dependent methyltransferase